jgi:hypothetical protein
MQRKMRRRASRRPPKSLKNLLSGLGDDPIIKILAHEEPDGEQPVQLEHNHFARRLLDRLA